MSAVVVEAVRTSVGRRNDDLSSIHPADSSAVVLNARVERAGINPVRVVGGLRSTGGRAGRRCRPHRLVDCRLAGVGPGRDPRPPARFVTTSRVLRVASGEAEHYDSSSQVMWDAREGRCCAGYPGPIAWLKEIEAGPDRLHPDGAIARCICWVVPVGASSPT
jgi:hypothetical protein